MHIYYFHIVSIFKKKSSLYDWIFLTDHIRLSAAYINRRIVQQTQGELRRFERRPSDSSVGKLVADELTSRRLLGY
jgi:hypothetical protein